jgi:hypothetical protein
MSQVILNASAHHQAFNAYHLHPHKWPENPPFAANLIKSDLRQTKTISLISKPHLVKSQPLYFSGKQ